MTAWKTRTKVLFRVNENQNYLNPFVPDVACIADDRALANFNLLMIVLCSRCFCRLVVSYPRITGTILFQQPRTCKCHFSLITTTILSWIQFNKHMAMFFVSVRGYVFQTSNKSVRQPSLRYVLLLAIRSFFRPARRDFSHVTM